MSRQNELFQGPLWRHKQTERQSLPSFLIRQGLKNIKVLFTSLLLELAEMEFWPVFVWFWPTVCWSGFHSLWFMCWSLQHCSLICPFEWTVTSAFISIATCSWIHGRTFHSLWLMSWSLLHCFLICAFEWTVTSTIIGIATCSWIHGRPFHSQCLKWWLLQCGFTMCFRLKGFFQGHLHRQVLLDRRSRIPKSVV